MKMLIPILAAVVSYLVFQLELPALYLTSISYIVVTYCVVYLAVLASLIYMLKSCDSSIGESLHFNMVTDMVLVKDCFTEITVLGLFAISIFAEYSQILVLFFSLGALGVNIKIIRHVREMYVEDLDKLISEG